MNNVLTCGFNPIHVFDENSEKYKSGRDNFEQYFHLIQAWLKLNLYAINDYGKMNKQTPYDIITNQIIELMEAVKIDVDIYMNHVVICDQRVERPNSVSVGQWFEYWDAHHEKSDLLMQINSLEKEIADLYWHNNI
jgi:23S rRNA pseudoU1915 N3-methylase RlmH